MENRIKQLEDKVAKLDEGLNSVLKSMEFMASIVNKNAEVTSDQFKSIADHISNLSETLKKIADSE